MENTEQWSNELYDVLCEMFEGTSLLQVQHVPGNNDIEANRKVFRMYHHITPAKWLQKFVEIVKPQKIENLNEATLMMEQRKLTVNEAKNDFP